MMLEKSGADLAEAMEEAGPADEAAEECSSELASSQAVKSNDPAAAGSTDGTAPGSLGAAEVRVVGSSVPAPMGAPEAPIRAAARGGGDGSSR